MAAIDNYITSLFKLKLGQTDHSIIEMTKIAKDNLSKIQRNDNTGLEEFQQFLNYVYYGKGENKYNINDNFITEFRSTVDNELVKIAQDYAQSVVEDGRINLLGSGLRAGSVGQLSYSEIKGRLAVVKEKIKNIKNKGQYDDMLKDMKIVLETLQSYLEQAEGFLGAKWNNNVSGNKLLTKSMTYNGVNLLEQINLLWNRATYIAEIPSNKKIGEVLEKSIPVTKKLFEALKEGQIQKILEEAFSQKSVGEQRTSTPGLVTASKGLVSIFTDAKNPKENPEVFSNYIFKDASDDSFTLSVSAIRGFQQKMDVEMELELPDDSSILKRNMQISAKSWSKMSGRSLGETTLLYALLRTLNFDSTIALGLQLDYSSKANDSSWTNNLIKQAKYIAVLDIIAGIGQEQGYSDSLVIQDRGKKEFHVFNIKDILEKIQENSSHFIVKGYDESALTTRTLEYGVHLMSQGWINALMTKMANQNISIVYKSKI